MSKIKYFSENLDVQSKTIILRLDLNVPLNEKKIQDKNYPTSILNFQKITSAKMELMWSR